MPGRIQLVIANATARINADDEQGEQHVRDATSRADGACAACVHHRGSAA